MDGQQTAEITLALSDWNKGEQAAKERLMPFVYNELKRQARILMFKERSSHTLQPTALVHEAFMRLSNQSGIEWRNRSHFFGIASRLMRQILIEHARKHSAAKRGSKPIHFSLDDVLVSIEERAESLLALDEALERLLKKNEEQAQIVEMKFFGGLQTKEIAQALNIGERSVARKWKAARIWLYRELSNR